MTEWGVTPEYINNRWTEELLTLMFIKRTQRIKRTTPQRESESSGSFGGEKRKVTDVELFKEIGFQPEVVQCRSK